MNDFNFELISTEKLTNLFLQQNVIDFSAAVLYLNEPTTTIQPLLDLVVEDKPATMTKTAKIHAILAALAVENHIKEIELMMGIFLIDPITFPEFITYFKDKSFQTIALTTSYLKINGQRYDFSSKKPVLERINKKIVREQKMDPHQSKEWKEKIYEDYIQKWLKRNSEIDYQLEKILKEEKELIELLYNY